MKNCPHPNCNGKIDMSLIVRHAESYGGSKSIVECPRCLRGVIVHSSVRIAVDIEPYRGRACSGTWGGDIPASA